MAAPTSVIWDRDPHTKAKHDMLRRYLAAWFPIIASRWSSTGATFVDAFAGPGEYTDGAEGSPLIALRAASRPDVTQHPTEMRLLFIEENRQRFDHLLGLIDRLGPLKSQTIVCSRHGSCETVLIPALDELGAWSGPMFVNFDGWGVDTPYDLVARIGQRQSTEVLVTFEAQWFTRFAQLEALDTGDRMFGETGWRAVSMEPPTAKRKFLVDRYIERIRRAGFPYTLTFEMVDEGGHSLFLVFGTGSVKGLEKMKDAMWSIDEVAGQRFQDPRDINQGTFDIATSPDLSLLRRQVLQLLESGPKTMASLTEYALLETVFKGTHVKPVVDSLALAGTVEVKKGRGYDKTIVSLPAFQRLPF